ncbi:MAG: hypothetical protein JNK09_05965 [Prolixibacteraceae bacterium]|nr:hypothetical protein [Prolixibacteraceae bacterium]
MAHEINNYLKIDIMKRLAMVLAVAFTMGLAASSVSASVKDDNAKKTEKKECCSKTTECSKDKKACCSEKKAEAPAKK